MDGFVQARDGGAPSIALVEQALDAVQQMLFVVWVRHAMDQPEVTAVW